MKLFTADIDNTLRGRRSPVPGPLTISAFQKMHEEGIVLGIASGRPLWQNVRDHYKEWKLPFQFDFLIGMNGGELWDKDTGESDEFHLLSRDTLKEIVEAFASFTDINPFVYRTGAEVSRYVDDEMLASGKRHGSKIIACSSDADLYSEPTGKILYRCGTVERALEIEKMGQKMFGRNISCFRTGPDLVELQDARNNKGEALKIYCHRHNIDLKDVIAFGDAENDIPMLEAAGWSVCMKNGMNDVKQICDDITAYTSDEDGVGRYLYDHAYIKK